jgi:hypothetical protein
MADLPERDDATKVLLTFPARPLTAEERKVLRSWVSAVDGFSAFVSERRADDPAIYRRIVISGRGTKRHTYLVHAPRGLDIWIVVSAVEGEDIGRFPTLHAALDFIHPVSV